MGWRATKNFLAVVSMRWLSDWRKTRDPSIPASEKRHGRDTWIPALATLGRDDNGGNGAICFASISAVIPGVAQHGVVRCRPGTQVPRHQKKRHGTDTWIPALAALGRRVSQPTRNRKFRRSRATSLAGMNLPWRKAHQGAAVLEPGTLVS